MTDQGNQKNMPPMDPSDARERITALWQPIETAPKDGSSILVYTVHDAIEVSNWYVVMREVYDPAGDDMYTKRVETFHEGWNGNKPTHWMPLPAPPEIPAPGSEVNADPSILQEFDGPHFVEGYMKRRND